MKRAKKIYSGTLDLAKAAEVFDRMHRLKDALESLQAQYVEDLAEVVAELSDAQSIDPALIRMAFAGERQKRKREARIAKMDSGKAYQLDLLADAAAGSDAIPAAWVVPKAEANFDPETGEIINEIPAGSPISSSVRPDKKVGDASSVPAPDSHSAGPVETTAKPKTASNPGAVASALGPISNNPSEEGEAYADEAATMERHISASPPPEMEIPDFLRRIPKRQEEFA